jgi:hypothetical protein
VSTLVKRQRRRAEDRLRIWDPSTLSTMLKTGSLGTGCAQDNPFDCAQDKKDLVSASNNFLVLFVGFWG